MTKTEEIKRYIERTKINAHLASGYQMYLQETLALAYMAEQTPIEAICLAFEYGKAKGYRMTKSKHLSGSTKPAPNARRK